MHQRKYFTLNFFINEIFSVEKFPNYGILLLLTRVDILFLLKCVGELEVAVKVSGWHTWSLQRGGYG